MRPIINGAGVEQFVFGSFVHWQNLVPRAYEQHVGDQTTTDNTMLVNQNKSTFTKQQVRKLLRNPDFQRLQSQKKLLFNMRILAIGALGILGHFVLIAIAQRHLDGSGAPLTFKFLSTARMWGVIGSCAVASIDAMLESTYFEPSPLPAVTGMRLARLLATVALGSVTCIVAASKRLLPSRIFFWPPDADDSAFVLDLAWISVLGVSTIAFVSFTAAYALLALARSASSIRWLSRFVRSVPGTLVCTVITSIVILRATIGALLIGATVSAPAQRARLLGKSPALVPRLQHVNAVVSEFLEESFSFTLFGSVRDPANAVLADHDHRELVMNAIVLVTLAVTLSAIVVNHATRLARRLRDWYEVDWPIPGDE